MKILLALALLALSACSTLSISPEQQIRDGSNSVTAAATVAGTLLRVEKITKAQAQSYRDVLGTAGKHLDVAFATLAACRVRTASSPATSPDPCQPTVASDIALGVSIAAEVSKTLNTK